MKEPTKLNQGEVLLVISRCDLLHAEAFFPKHERFPAKPSWDMTVKEARAKYRAYDKVIQRLNNRLNPR